VGGGRITEETRELDPRGAKDKGVELALIAADDGVAENATAELETAALDAVIWT
jgi:hypothetical protein